MISIKMQHILKDLFKKDREHSIRTIIYTEYGFQDDLEGLLNK